VRTNDFIQDLGSLENYIREQQEKDSKPSAGKSQRKLGQSSAVVSVNVFVHFTLWTFAAISHVICWDSPNT
jgi:hypothetical protein